MYRRLQGARAVSVSVVTDSAAGLPPEVAERYGITVVPAWLVIGGEQRREDEVPPREVLERWDEGVSTSVPTPADFVDAVRRSGGGDGTVVLTVAGALTGINRSAEIAARELGEGVRVLDTGTGVGSQALIAVAAARAAAAGATLEEVVDVAESVGRRVMLVATLSDLEHLVRSGRVPGLARWAGRQLNLNPIVELGAGRVRPLRPSLSREAAFERMIARVRRNAPAGDAILHAVAFHSLEPDVAERLLKRVTDGAATGDVFVGAFGAAMVSHAGPGVVGLSWWWEETPG